jgi:hypothetical protein
VAACPAGAITGAHFNNQQVFAEIEGALWDAIYEEKHRAAPEPHVESPHGVPAPHSNPLATV